MKKCIKLVISKNLRDTRSTKYKTLRGKLPSILSLNGGSRRDKHSNFQVNQAIISHRYVPVCCSCRYLHSFVTFIIVDVICAARPDAKQGTEQSVHHTTKHHQMAALREMTLTLAIRINKRRIKEVME